MTGPVTDRRPCSAAAAMLTVSLLVAIVAPASGQTFSASLSGAVTDPSGAPVPGVTVVVRNQATLESREETTGADGRYVFSQLAPGMYEVTAELTGFKRFRQVDLPLRANQAGELAIELAVGALADEVTVTAPTVALDTRSANQSVTLSSRMVSDLPQSTRTPFGLVNGLAGTTSTVGRVIGNSQGANLDQLFSGFALNGGRDFSNLILIDGAPATAGDWGGLLVSPSPDSVEEMQVARNAYDAEFGRSGGGVVNVVTRGGSSVFHGGGWEFYRGDNLDANSWTNNAAGIEKTDFSRNQFGGQIGGPLWRSKKVFFYGSYEGLRESYPFTTGFGVRVPTDLERRGDFSQTRNPDGSLAVIYNPFTTRPDPANPGQFIRDPFPGNVIPDNLIDPVGRQVMALFPEPNRAGDPVTSVDNFFVSDTGTNVRDEVDARVDWARSGGHTMYGRVSFAPRSGNEPPAYIGTGVEAEPININPRVHATISNTFIPNSKWVINVLVGGGYWREEQQPQSLGKLTAADIGLSPDLFQAPIFPLFNFDGYLGLGNPQSALRSFPRTTYSLQANATRELASHSLRFGFWAESNLINNVDRHGGEFSFDRGMTSGPIAQFNSQTTGNAIASLLLGTGAGGNSQFRADLAASLRYYAGYVQDVWTVTDRLTVNAGLRYEIQRPATERYNRIAWFNPDVANPIGDQVGMPLKGGIEFANEDNRGQWEQDWNDLAPRVGVAYRWTDKLVTRAGYGLFYQAASALYTFDPVPGVSNRTDWFSANGFVPVNLLSNPYPQGVAKQGEGAQGLATYIGFTPDQVWLREPHHTPYKHQYSVDLQYQLNPNTVVEIGYAGSRGRNQLLGQPSSFNQLPTQYLSLGDALNEQVPNPFFGVITDETELAGPTVPRHRLLRPFPHFSEIVLSRSIPGATSSYDALNLKYSRAFSDGLAAIATYQYSRNYDNASEDQGWGIDDQWRDTYNKQLERSVSAHDVPHSFALSLLYELPFGRERKMANSMPAAAEAVLGGWQVATIVRVQTGNPILLRAPNNLDAYGFFVARPNQVGDPMDIADRTPENFFNRDAFETPAPFTIGNAPRYSTDLREEPIKNMDFTASKRWAVAGYSVEFRADFLNLFNHPQIGLGGFHPVDPSDERYGQADGAINGPRNIQLGLKVRF